MEGLNPSVGNVDFEGESVNPLDDYDQTLDSG
jgi:hypothetical protein